MYGHIYSRFHFPLYILRLMEERQKTTRWRVYGKCDCDNVTHCDCIINDNVISDHGQTDFDYITYCDCLFVIS
jgi:hypothetical protein